MKDLMIILAESMKKDRKTVDMNIAEITTRAAQIIFEDCFGKITEDMLDEPHFEEFFRSLATEIGIQIHEIWKITQDEIEKNN